MIILYIHGEKKRISALWDRYAAAAKEHMGFHSCQPRTGMWGFNRNRFSETGESCKKNPWEVSGAADQVQRIRPQHQSCGGPAVDSCRFWHSRLQSIHCKCVCVVDLLDKQPAGWISLTTDNIFLASKILSLCYSIIESPVITQRLGS